MENKVYDLKKRSYIYALEMIKFLEGLAKDYISETIGRMLLCIGYSDHKRQETVLAF